VREAAQKAGRVLVVEMSQGQMVEDVRLAVGGAVPVDFCGTLGGVTPQVDDLAERIKAYAR
jgi:2-oxoglutarate ferredoxin oxidoreductase subunit alpha